MTNGLGPSVLLICAFARLSGDYEMLPNFDNRPPFLDETVYASHHQPSADSSSRLHTWPSIRQPYAGFLSCCMDLPPPPLPPPPPPSPPSPPIATTNAIARTRTYLRTHNIYLRRRDDTHLLDKVLPRRVEMNTNLTQCMCDHAYAYSKLYRGVSILAMCIDLFSFNPYPTPVPRYTA